MGICQVIQYYTPPTTGGGLICKKNKSLNKNVYAQPGFYFFFTTIIMITKMQTQVDAQVPGPGPPARADPSGTDGVTSGHRKRWPRRWDP